MRETRPVAVNMYCTYIGTILTDGDDYTRTNELTTSQSFDKHLALLSMGIPSQNADPTTRYIQSPSTLMTIHHTADNKALTQRHSTAQQQSMYTCIATHRSTSTGVNATQKRANDIHGVTRDARCWDTCLQPKRTTNIKRQKRNTITRQSTN